MAIDRRAFLRAGATAAVVTTVGVGTELPAHSGQRRARATDWSQLRAAIAGDVVLPGDTGYTEAIKLQVATFDAIQPQAVVYCTSAADVAAAVRFDRTNGMRPVPRSGGHSNAGFSTGTGMVVDLSRMNSVTVGSGSVVVGGGTQAIDAHTALSPQGLTVLSGTCATVAAGGFVTGGGMGLLTREYGMASDRLVAAEVVLADGSIVRSNTASRSDLLWALKGGGGGNFGIVTRYWLQPVTISTIVNYSLVFPWPAAAAVLGGWQQWLANLPAAVSANLVIVMPNASPEAVPVVQVSGTSTGDLAALNTLLDTFVGLVGSAPVVRNVASLPYGQAMMNVWGCGTFTAAQCHRTGYNPEGLLPRNVWALSRGRFFDRVLTATAIQQILTAFDAERRAGQTRILSLRGMGGKANEKSRTETAFVHRTSKFYLGLAYGLTNPAATEDDKAAVGARLNAGFAAMDPYSNHESFQNFMDPLLTDWRQSYYGENYARLKRVKCKYDPDRVFSFPQAIGS
ncbi:MAG: FAD-binding oxidoreductase [Streptosporangiaceae bacterium]